MAQSTSIPHIPAFYIAPRLNCISQLVELEHNSQTPVACLTGHYDLYDDVQYKIKSGTMRFSHDRSGFYGTWCAGRRDSRESVSRPNHRERGPTTVRPVLTVLRTQRMTTAAARASRPACMGQGTRSHQHGTISCTYVHPCYTCHMPSAGVCHQVCILMIMVEETPSACSMRLHKQERSGKAQQRYRSYCAVSAN